MKPHALNDRVLKKRLCIGAKCPKCECLDWCGYGKEAVKRGMFDDV
jgi:Zn ribbon nucleic-acid-binding protein